MIDSLDGFRHSKWLSFMKPRLVLARNLLSSSGVIFISIDDREMASLKMLCDSIFGEDNFIANIIVKSNPRGSQSAKEIANLHEYILLYAKNIAKSEIVGHELTEDMQSEYKWLDENGSYRLLGLRQRGGFWRASERPNLFYPFYVNDSTGDISLSKDDKRSLAIFPFQPSSGEKGTWRWSKEKVEKDIGFLVAKAVKRKGELVWDIYQKDYLSSGSAERRTKAKTLWDEKEMNYQNAAMKLKTLFDKTVFTYAKPVYLVQRAMGMIGFKDNDCVLDFFAGSGTTGHAVMKINASDGTNRRFILCTNNENNICKNVTYERIKRVNESEGYDESLKYYHIDFVPTKGRIYYDYAPELLEHVRELVELEHGTNFIDDLDNIIVLTDDEADVFTENTEALSQCKRLYIGHDVLLTAEQEELLKLFSINIIIVPDCYYKGLEG